MSFMEIHLTLQILAQSQKRISDPINGLVSTGRMKSLVNYCIGKEMDSLSILRRMMQFGFQIRIL